MTDKAKSEFDTATKQYFEQVAFAPDDRQPPQRWWQDTCEPLKGVQDVIPDDLCVRLGIVAGSSYDTGQNAFLTHLQQNLKPWGGGGWTGRP